MWYMYHRCSSYICPFYNFMQCSNTCDNCTHNDGKSRAAEKIYERYYESREGKLQREKTTRYCSLPSCNKGISRPCHLQDKEYKPCLVGQIWGLLGVSKPFKLLVVSQVTSWKNFLENTQTSKHSLECVLSSTKLCKMKSCPLFLADQLAC